MKRLNALITTIIFALMSVGLQAQGNHFYNLNTVGDLNLNTVLSLYQDERNYIWIGTPNGAGVYHGRELTMFKHDKLNPGSLPNNEIKQITGDRKGHVYLRTGDKSIVKYDIASAEFKVLVPSVANFIHLNPETGLYYSTGSEVCRYDERTGKSESLYSMEDMRMTISSVYEDEGRLYIGTYGNGLYILENNNLRHVVTHGYINDIFKDSKGLFWLTSVYGDGIFVLDHGRVINYRHDPRDLSSISSDKTQRCCEDAEGNIWIGTFCGLNCFDRKTGRFTRYSAPGFSENSITSVLCDHQGTIWAGTYYFGLYFFNRHQQSYQIYRQAYSPLNGLSSAVISRMVEDDSRRLWIATSRGGLNAYDLKSGTFKWYLKTGKANEISSNNIKSLYHDPSRDCLWIGTHLGGLDRLDLKTGKFTNYRHRDGDPKSLPSNIVTDIQKWHRQLILATKGTISLFDPETGSCNPLFANENYRQVTGHCNQLLIDSKGRLWMAHTSSGAFCYDLEQKTMSIFKNDGNVPGGISSGRVNYLYEDSKGQIWFCNNQNGLDLYDENKGRFINYDVENCGMASNTVFAIQELDSNRYILTSDAGYSVLDRELGECTNFINNRNSPLSSAAEKCLLQASDGNIYIGGMNGMISFGKEQLQKSPRHYDIRPYLLTVDGVEVTPGDESGILSEDLSYTKQIRLGPGINSMGLEYAVTDYLPYDYDRILYRMDPYTEDWNVLPENRRIAFTRLPPGKYTLVVRAETAEGLEPAESRLDITVVTPFYKTDAAVILYIFVAAALAWIILHTWKNRMRLQETVRFEQQQSKREKELNTYKLRFFTNISHEFRTPLTIIIAQIEMLMEKSSLDKYTHSALMRVYKNCLLLKDLISELMDFRKQEQGYLKLKVSERNIVTYINELYLNFIPYAKKKQITYKFFKIYDDIPVWFDPKQLQKAINNLIVNAFRYVQEGGKVTVSVNKDSSHVVIDVVNTGHGIPKEDIGKIFDRFYQAGDSHAGTGVGLALAKGIVELHGGEISVSSEIGKETMFRIILPLGNQHFQPEQLSGNPASANEALDAEGEEKARQLLQSMDEIMAEAPEKAEEQVGDNLGDASRRTILVVEDSNTLRETLIQLFSPFYNVLSASEGDHAYELACKVLPDLIVSDVMIPNLSGLELCRKLKTQEPTSLIPVVLLSAKADDLQIIEGFKCGADDYIVKPFNSKLLVSRCNNLVNNRMLLRDHYLELKDAAPQQVMANSENEKKFLVKAQNIVRKHMEDNTFNIEVLARELGVSRTKLFTRLKDINGSTPLEFIMGIKIDEAAKMLKDNPELNISEISDRTGFSSPKYFRKYFKTRYGVTPQDFRNG